MTILEMLGQSAILTVLGVGIVFGFLLIVVVVVSQFERVFKPRGSKANKEPVAPASASAPVSQCTGVSPQLVAAITAAVHEYRSQG